MTDYKTGNELKLFAVCQDTGDRFEIDDLYWFEENGVHDWGGVGHYDKFWFELYIGEKMIHTTKIVINK